MDITAMFRYTPAAIALLLNNIYGLYPAFPHIHSKQQWLM